MKFSDTINAFAIAALVASTSALLFTTSCEPLRSLAT
jgi:hypothetical protein